VAFLVKTPLVALAAFAAALWVVWRRRRAPGGALGFVLLPPAVYAAVSLLSTLNIGHRHLLPVYPGLFVLAGALAEPSRRRWIPIAALLIVLAPFFVFSPPWRPARVYPHALAYVNELGGGPREGHRVLVDSNLDWGQGLCALSRELDARGISDPINLCYFGTADPRWHGIAHRNLAGCYAFEPERPLAEAIRPGWLAISATHRAGVYARPIPDWMTLLERAEPAGAVGHSIFLYKLP